MKLLGKLAQSSIKKDSSSSSESDDDDESSAKKPVTSKGTKSLNRSKL